MLEEEVSNPPGVTVSVEYVIVWTNTPFLNVDTTKSFPVDFEAFGVFIL